MTTTTMTEESLGTTLHTTSYTTSHSNSSNDSNFTSTFSEFKEGDEILTNLPDAHNALRISNNIRNRIEMKKFSIIKEKIIEAIMKGESGIILYCQDIRPEGYVERELKNLGYTVKVGEKSPLTGIVILYVCWNERKDKHKE